MAIVCRFECNECHMMRARECVCVNRLRVAKLQNFACSQISNGQLLFVISARLAEVFSGLCIFAIAQKFMIIFVKSLVLTAISSAVSLLPTVPV